MAVTEQQYRETQEIIDAKDFLGNPIKVGDKVVFTTLKYRDFTIGKISKLTNKMVWIKHESNCSRPSKVETKQFHDQVIKIDNP